jgi:hypothetical protein
MKDEGFTKIRNGILEHINAGKFSPSDLGVYLFLHRTCDWRTGIYKGTAIGIAFGFGNVYHKNVVKHALSSLREARFINYRLGTGSKGYYSILIDKFEPTFGPLKGQRLNAWKHGSKVIAAYDPLEASRPEADPDLARFSPASSPDVAPIPYVPYVPDYPNNPNNNTYDVDDEPEKLPDMGQETEKQAKTMR